MIKPMRIKRPIIPLKNVILVFPRPFRTLLRVVFKYKKGQSHASTVIKFPASVFEKINSPRKFPKSRKKRRQQQPKKMQKVKDFLRVFFKVSKCPPACDSETAGRSIKEIEPVSAFGNKINGSAIPVKIP